MILSHVLNQTSDPILSKAPSGTLYEVYGFYGIVMGTGSNRFSILSAPVEEELAEFSPQEGKTGNLLFMIETDAAISASFLLSNPVRTKYLTFIRGGATSAVALLMVDYKLVKASRAELIWEWLSKRR